MLDGFVKRKHAIGVGNINAFCCATASAGEKISATTRMDTSLVGKMHIHFLPRIRHGDNHRIVAHDVIGAGVI